MLEKTAHEKSEDTLRGHSEAKIHAGIADCEIQENNLARVVALGQIQPEQIGSVSQALAERKGRVVDCQFTADFAPA